MTSKVSSSWIENLEGDAAIHRRFDALICLSNPDYGLYMEHPIPWRSPRQDLPFDRLRQYQECFATRKRRDRLPASGAPGRPARDGFGIGGELNHWVDRTSQR
jgi:hypothetical protein